MTTVPDVPNFDDFTFDILEHPSGNPICPLGTSLLEIEFSVLPGVTTDRLQSAVFTILDTSLAADYIDPTARQYLRIVPYNDEDRTLYGLIANLTQHYGGEEADGSTYNMIDVEVVGTEALLDNRESYRRPGTTIDPLEGTSVYPDDFAKYMVRETSLPGTCDNDAEGNSRDWAWGTLSVDADASECASAVDISINEGKVGQAIQGLADKYDFAFELRPTFSGGAVTFTFKTQSPAGDDCTDGNTDGNTEVILNDFVEAMIPEAEYHRTLLPMVNALHGNGYEEVELDSDSITNWGRWEGASRSSGQAKIQIELEHLKDREGCTFRYDAQGSGNAYKWLEHFDCGDKVTFSNNRLGIAARDETVAAIAASFPEGQLELAIRWGDKTPTYTDDEKNENLAPSPGAIIGPGDSYGGFWARDDGNAYLYPRESGDDVRIGSTIHLDASTGHIEADRLEPYGGSAQTYIQADATVLNIASESNMRFRVGGALVAQIDGNSFYPRVANGQLGTISYPWLYLRLATAGKIYHVDGAADTVLGWDGAAYSPMTLADMGIQEIADNLWELDTQITPVNQAHDVRIGTEILLDASNGHIEADRIEPYGGSAQTYIQTDSTVLNIASESNMRFRVGGALVAQMDGTSFYSRTASGQLGTGTYPWLHVYLKTAGRIYHADVDASTGYVLVKGAGAWFEPGTLSMDDLTDGHDPVTLDANADTLLSLSSQELGLDTQSANLVFAGPGSGGAAVPTFRSLVFADIPDHRHPVNGNTGSGTASGTTGSYAPTANAIIVNAATPVGGASPLYFDSTILSTSNPGGWVLIYARTGSHDHTFSDAHTHPVAIQSGAPAAP